MLLKVSLTVFLLIGLFLILIGIMYLTASQFMPYHSEAIQTSWTDLSTNYQGLFLGLLKGAGAGQLVVGLLICAMSIVSLRRSVRPYIVMLPTICIGYSFLMVYAMHIVRSSTEGTPPFLSGVVMTLAAVLASGLLVFGYRSGGGLDHERD